MPAKPDPLFRVFDASKERAQIAETLLSSAARLISGRAEREIVMGICDALTRTSPRIRLAWTWFGPQGTQLIQPQIYAGQAAAYARNISIRRSLLTQNGPVFAVLDGKPLEAFNISPWSLYGPWRKLAAEYGIRNVLALPVHSRFSGYGGVFVLYADTDDYFNLVGTGLFSALASLFSSVLTASSERIEIEHSAHHDALTGLLNRHALAQIEPRLLRASDNDPTVCVLLLDLDNFKRINDQSGHTTGDLVLQAAARTLAKTVREQDHVVRWGGEEFLICMPHTSLQDGLLAAEKLREAIANLTDPLHVTVSIGIAELEPQQKIALAADRADIGLLQAKAAGRNRVCLAP